MKINSANANLMKIISAKSAFTAKKQNEGSGLPSINEQLRRDSVQLSCNAIQVSQKEHWTARVHADGTVEEPMADCSRLQGGYLMDAVFGIMNLDSVNGVYDECIAKGMTEEEAGKAFEEKLCAILGNYQEALALALEFVPLDENATGEIISYSDVYDENGQLKVPVKLTMEQYQNNLKEILDQMMNALKARKDEFSGLYQVQFGE